MQDTSPDTQATQPTSPGADSAPSEAASADTVPAEPTDAAADVGKGIAESLQQVESNFEQFANDPSLDNAVAIFGPMLLDLGQAIVGLIVLLVIVTIVSRTVQRICRAAFSKMGLEDTVAIFLARMAKYAIWIITVPIAFELFGVKTTSIAAVIGAAGLAIGLAMQGSLSNIAAGMMLLLLRPFKIDDWVELDDEFGVVIDIGLFYTYLRTFSNKLVILPNSEVLSHKIENFTVNDERRVDVPVGVAYDTDLDTAYKVLSKAAKEATHKDTTSEPDVILVDFGASSINFEVRVWCPSREYLSVRTQAILSIERALRDASIEIPFPQRVVHLERTDGVV